MSYVTDVVVHVDYAPEEVERQIAEPFPFESKGLKRIDLEGAGGSKVFQGDVYVGAFNYLDAKALVEWFSALPWGDTGNALMSTSTEGEVFRVVVVRGGSIATRLRGAG